MSQTGVCCPLWSHNCSPGPTFPEASPDHHAIPTWCGDDLDWTVLAGLHQPLPGHLTVADTLPGLGVPAAGDEAETAGAGVLAVAAVQGDGLHVVRGEDDQPRLRGRLVRGLHYQEVEDWDGLTEDLYLLLYEGGLHAGLVSAHQGLDDFPPVGSNEQSVISGPPQVRHSSLDGNLSEELSVPELDEDWTVRPAEDGLVHQTVVLDEVQARLGQAGALVVTLARPGAGHLAGGQGQPVGVHPLLSLEIPIETSVQVGQRKPAHRTAEDGVWWSGEHPVEDLIVQRVGEEVGGGLDLVEVERILSRHGAVQSSLEEGSPPVTEPVGPTLVSLAHSRHSAEDGLAAVHELHGGLPEEEVDVVLVLQTAHKVRGVEMFVVVLLRPEVVLNDQRVRP